MKENGMGLDGIEFHGMECDEMKWNGMYQNADLMALVLNTFQCTD